MHKPVTSYCRETSTSDADGVHLWSVSDEQRLCLRTCEAWLQLFLMLFSSSLSITYWLTDSLQVCPFRNNKLLVSWSLFLSYPLADRLEHARIGSMLKIPPSCARSPNDSSTLPRGNSSILAGCLTGRGLMTGAPYWPENLVPIVFFLKKPVKWLLTNSSFAQDSSFPPS